MTDKPAPTPRRERLRLPPNFRDVTAEKIGTVTGIYGCGEGNEGTDRHHASSR
jgi:hypothetical protein